ncbi:MAG: sigma-70 family RNA polymerase sigma factor [Cytophagales bacterium]|nr:sigma-70 family RNA polymerase sigma factor [Cytophagales bacterium]
MEDNHSNGNAISGRYLYRSASDPQIWLDFLRGSKAAYAHLYRQYFSTLYNYGYKLAQNRSLTEDCIQDVFLYILEHRESLSPTNSVKYYLFKALRSEILKRLKKRLSTEGIEDGGGEENFSLAFSYESSWLEARITSERNQQLLNALNQLPARQKEAIFLRFYEGLSFAEIAEVMEVEQTSVYKVVYKGIASLQKQVSLRGLLALGLLLRAATDAWPTPLGGPFLLCALQSTGLFLYMI